MLVDARRAVVATPQLWGLAGTLLYIVGGVTTLYSLDSHSSTVIALAVPLAVQEMTLAVWLIFQGWSRSIRHRAVGEPEPQTTHR